MNYLHQKTKWKPLHTSILGLRNSKSASSTSCLAWKKTISCNLRVTRLSDSPQYEALSYCWGRPNPQRNITVNGKALSIGPSLYHALKDLRRKDTPRALWADAICINQKDDAEKSFQVALMATIYRSAARTVIWLGTSNLLTSRAMLVLQAVRECSMFPRLRDHWSSWRDCQRRVRRVGGSYLRIGEEIKKERDDPLRKNWIWERVYDQLALWYFYKRPWFYRMWIIQEVALSKDLIIQSGNEMMDFDCLVYVWYRHAISGIIPYRAQSPMQERWTRDSKREDHEDDLLAVFSRHESTGVTDLRDKVYGILGIVKHRPEVIDIDYSKDLANTFIDFTKRALQTRPRNLDVLSKSQGDGPCSIPDLPSWCLSWKFDENNETHSQTFVDSVGGFQRPSVPTRIPDNWNPEIEFSDSEPKVLGIIGQHLDAITTAGPVMRLGSWDGPRTTFASYLEWRRICGVDIDSVYRHTGEEPCQVLYFMLQNMSPGGDQGKWKQVVPHHIVLDRFIMKMIDMLPFWRRASVELGLLLLTVWFVFAFATGIGNDSGSDEGYWILRSSVYAWGRAVFRTSRGYVGMGVPHTKAGNQIFLIRGASVPFILRPSGDRWKLVGEAYVHDVMDRQLWDQAEDKRIWVE
ncbi:heterokaryon incompatibility protein-domain-containing protein [Triangularia verruculosa]|uniref:Heterokaryon incompatibility protein-domain-containing protein n=1 Tax=Triangularia verruculosa TaxID=2587418 RepID=A0AAN6XRA7_9PEZI|nr:heterokaryon incompatibility protein-domain-containing protein [Triangularia verruculosa]